MAAPSILSGVLYMSPYSRRARALLLSASFSTLCTGAALAASPEISEPVDQPIETIIVLGRSDSAESARMAVLPVREGRLSTLPDLFRASPGIVLEPVFGGIDHPRFAIRGSGLQRGTQPAGRGIELRLDGLPMSFADTSFDFVEWIDPLFFKSVAVLRGGRGVLAGAAALGGVVDFRGQEGAGPLEALGRGEAGSFGYRRGQISLSGGDEVSAFATGTWFKQRGYRDHNEQEASRGYAAIEGNLTETTRFRLSLLASASELELPGPMTLAQIEAGSREAQPGNLAGDWRRTSDRSRVAGGLSYSSAGTNADLDVSYMSTDVEFRRRDVQIDDSVDLSVRGRLFDTFDLAAGEGGIGVEVIYQKGERDGRLFLNGGGTIPTFTGTTGLLWADNAFDASRLSIQASLEVPLDETLRLELVGGWHRHEREIAENFPTRAARPAATFDRSYESLSGLALVSWDVADDLNVFAAVSHVMEPPTFDVLFINVAGTGAGAANVNGANPRRPVTVDLDAQSATTIEAGIKGRLGPFDLDVTIYRAWLDGEIVSTSDFVTQTVSSVGNADRTTRWGIEASIDVGLAGDIFTEGDQVVAGLDWTWTNARFSDDATFGDNRLPILAEHIIEANLGYSAQSGFYGGVFATIVPQGGFADYANTLRSDGYATLGARVGYQGETFTLFLEGRNLTDERYAATVITAQNNLGGFDNAAFAPGEGAAVTIGIEGRF